LKYYWGEDILLSGIFIEYIKILRKGSGVLMKKFKRLGSILISGILLIGLIGCGAQKPSAVVTEYFKEVKKGDTGKSNELLKGSIEESGKESVSVDDYSEEITKLLSDSLKKLDFKINNETINGDKAVVNVTINGDNISMAMTEAIMKSFGSLFELAFTNPDMAEEESNNIMNDAMIESFKNITSDERTGDLTLTKVDKSWTLDNDDELYRLVLGEAKVTPDESNR